MVLDSQHGHNDPTIVAIPTKRGNRDPAMRGPTGEVVAIKNSVMPKPAVVKNNPIGPATMKSMNTEKRAIVAIKTFILKNRNSNLSRKNNYSTSKFTYVFLDQGLRKYIQINVEYSVVTKLFFVIRERNITKN